MIQLIYEQLIAWGGGFVVVFETGSCLYLQLALNYWQFSCLCFPGADIIDLHSLLQPASLLFSLFVCLFFPPNHIYQSSFFILYSVFM